MYTSQKTKVSKETENNLLSDICSLEKSLRSDNYERYLEMKSELYMINEDAIKGH